MKTRDEWSQSILDWLEKHTPKFKRIDETTVEMTYANGTVLEVVIGDSVVDCVSVALLDAEE